MDISGVFDQKLEALKKLEAQPQLVSMYTTCNRWRGIESHCEYAEGFIRFAPDAPIVDLLRK